MTYLSKEDMCDLVEFASDHIEHFDAVPMEYETRDGREVHFSDIWSICRFMLPANDNPER